MHQTKVYSAARAPGEEHIPNYPKGFIALRIVQLILAVMVIGLTAFGCATVSPLLGLTGVYLSLFSGIATLIVGVYYLVSKFGPKKAYNYWAVLALDIFLIIFWIAGFALLAAQIAPYADGVTVCNYYVCEKVALTSGDVVILGCLAGAAGIGCAEFILFVVSLAIHSVMMHRHRTAGLHCSPTGANAIRPVLAGDNPYPGSSHGLTAVAEKREAMTSAQHLGYGAGAGHPHQQYPAAAFVPQPQGMAAAAEYAQPLPQFVGAYVQPQQ